MTPKLKSEPTTASSTPRARTSNSRARGGSTANEENTLLRDVNRWVTVIVLPILLTAMLGFGTWTVVTINEANKNIAVMQNQIVNGQTQRASDNADLQNSVNSNNTQLTSSLGELKSSINLLAAAVDGLRQSQSNQAASIAVLMDQHDKGNSK